MAHFRCPACGQARPKAKFDQAGTHKLEVIELRGLGRGNGFDRSTRPADLASLTYLRDRLDAARARVEQQIVAAQQAPISRVASTSRPAPPPCPVCRTPMTWVSFGLRPVCPRCRK